MCQSNLPARLPVFGWVTGLTLAACYLLCVTAYGWNEPESYKKLKWGDPIEGVKEIIKARDREIHNVGARGKRFTEIGYGRRRPSNAVPQLLGRQACRGFLYVFRQ